MTLKNCHWKASVLPNTQEGSSQTASALSMTLLTGFEFWPKILMSLYGNSQAQHASLQFWLVKTSFAFTIAWYLHMWGSPQATGLLKLRSVQQSFFLALFESKSKKEAPLGALEMPCTVHAFHLWCANMWKHNFWCLLKKIKTSSTHIDIASRAYSATNF